MRLVRHVAHMGEPQTKKPLETVILQCILTKYWFHVIPWQDFFEHDNQLSGFKKAGNT
jgi:hypothetical protein